MSINSNVSLTLLRSNMDRLLKACLAFFCFSTFVSSGVALTRIENTVSIAGPGEQTLHIVSIIKGIREPQFEVAVPIWTPGHYVTEEYARNISRLAFYDQLGRPLHHQRIQDSIWLLDTRGASQVKVEFD